MRRGLRRGFAKPGPGGSAPPKGAPPAPPKALSGYTKSIRAAGSGLRRTLRRRGLRQGGLRRARPSGRPQPAHREGAPAWPPWRKWPGAAGLESLRQSTEGPPQALSSGRRLLAGANASSSPSDHASATIALGCSPTPVLRQRSALPPPAPAGGLSPKSQSPNDPGGGQKPFARKGVMTQAENFTTFGPFLRYTQA